MWRASKCMVGSSGIGIRDLGAARTSFVLSHNLFVHVNSRPGHASGRSVRVHGGGVHGNGRFVHVYCASVPVYGGSVHVDRASVPVYGRAVHGYSGSGHGLCTSKNMSLTTV
jgi:hypothetical protein